MTELLHPCIFELLSNDNPSNSSKHNSVKVHEIISLIEDDGWYLWTTKGSHRQFKHPTKKGRVTVAGKPSDDLAKGTEKSIVKQAGLK